MLVFISFYRKYNRVTVVASFNIDLYHHIISYPHSRGYISPFTQTRLLHERFQVIHS